MTKKTHKSSRGAPQTLAAAGAATARAAQYYFYPRTEAKRHRKRVSTWASDVKKDVLAEARTIGDFDKEQLLKVVDGIAKAYDGIRGVSKSELRAAADELKENWKNLKMEVSSSTIGVSSGAKKTARRAGRPVSAKHKGAKGKALPSLIIKRKS